MIRLCAKVILILIIACILGVVVFYVLGHAEPPHSGIGQCPSGLVVSGLNPNAPPTCVNGGGGGLPGTNSGIINVVTQGVVCDGSTDNAAALQTAVNAAANIASPVSTGIAAIPAACNASTGHQLRINSGITIPDNVCLVGLAGSAHTAVDAVEIDYAGSGVAFTSTNTSGSCLTNARVKNTGTGTIGVDLQGTSKFYIDGVNVNGFSQNGVLYEDSSTSSSLYNHMEDTLLNNNGVALYFNQHNSGKVVNSNTFVNDQFLSSTGAENIHFTGTANENGFLGTDLSHATTGVLCDAQSCRDTVFSGTTTAEGTGTVFNLGVDVENFRVDAVDGGFFNGNNGSPIVADSTATYSVCWGVLGNFADECDFQGSRFATYQEAVTFQDSTQQANIGTHGNSILQSQTFTNATWTKVNPTAQTLTDNAVAAANASTTATKVALAGNSLNAFVRQSFSNGGSIQNTCFTESISFKQDASSSGTMIPYFTIALQDGAGANQEFRNYPITTSWQRKSVVNCFPNSTSTSVLAYALNVTAANNTNASAKIDIWGAQLTKTSTPVGYDATTSSVAALTVGLTAANASLINPLPVASGGTQCGAPVTFANLPGSPTNGEICTVTDSSTGCTAGTAVTAGGGGTNCQVTYNGTNWLPAGGASSAASGGFTTAGTGLNGAGSTVSLTTPVSVANGGTNATAAGQTASNNIGAPPYGVDVNSSGQVTASHLASPLPFAQGGTASTVGPANVWDSDHTNSGSPGTTANDLVVFDSSVNMKNAPAGYTGVPFGICDSTCGTSGTPIILRFGDHLCNFDATTVVAGDCVGVSTTTAGQCTDIGACSSATGASVGTVSQTGGAGNNPYTIELGSAGAAGGGSGNVNPATVVGSTAYYDSTKKNISAQADFLDVAAFGLATANAGTVNDTDLCKSGGGIANTANCTATSLYGVESASHLSAQWGQGTYSFTATKTIELDSNFNGLIWQGMGAGSPGGAGGPKGTQLSFAFNPNSGSPLSITNASVSSFTRTYTATNSLSTFDDVIVETCSTGSGNPGTFDGTGQVLASGLSGSAFKVNNLTAEYTVSGSCTNGSVYWPQFLLTGANPMSFRDMVISGPGSGNSGSEGSTIAFSSLNTIDGSASLKGAYFMDNVVIQKFYQAIAATGDLSGSIWRNMYIFQNQNAFYGQDNQAVLSTFITPIRLAADTDVIVQDSIGTRVSVEGGHGFPQNGGAFIHTLSSFNPPAGTDQPLTLIHGMHIEYGASCSACQVFLDDNTSGSEQRVVFDNDNLAIGSCSGTTGDETLVVNPDTTLELDGINSPSNCSTGYGFVGLYNTASNSHPPVLIWKGGTAIPDSNGATYQDPLPRMWILSGLPRTGATMFNPQNSLVNDNEPVVDIENFKYLAASGYSVLTWRSNAGVHKGYSAPNISGGIKTTQLGTPGTCKCTGTAGANNLAFRVMCASVNGTATPSAQGWTPPSASCTCTSGDTTPTVANPVTLQWPHMDGAQFCMPAFATGTGGGELPLSNTQTVNNNEKLTTASTSGSLTTSDTTGEISAAGGFLNGTNSGVEFQISAGSNTFGNPTTGTGLQSFVTNAVIATQKVLNAGHFTSLNCVNQTLNGGSCSNAPTVNVFDGTSNTGSTLSCSTTVQTKGNQTTTPETLTFAAGDVIGIYVSAQGATCVAPIFNITATAVEP